MAHIVDRYHRAITFESPGHSGGVAPRKLLAGQKTDAIGSLVISVYPPAAGAEPTRQQTDVVYVVLRGELKVTCDESVYVLAPYDAMCIRSGSVRALVNESDAEAHLLVLRPGMLPAAVESERA
ncbi:cupin domain-containing protein [Mycolicibacterium bacteremicum]|uniref:cupin domain-containing protein n=1 Tax=Mycolicibacterium bacteremicum TaxID=564198 RepID=UPI00350E3C57